MVCTWYTCTLHLYQNSFVVIYFNFHFHHFFAAFWWNLCLNFLTKEHVNGVILCAHNESKWIMYFLKIMKSIKGLKRKMWLQKCSALNQKLHPFPWCSFDFVHVPASFSFYSIWHAVRTLHRMSWLHSELSHWKFMNWIWFHIIYFASFYILYGMKWQWR